MQEFRHACNSALHRYAALAAAATSGTAAVLVQMQLGVGTTVCCALAVGRETRATMPAPAAAHMPHQHPMGARPALQLLQSSGAMRPPPTMSSCSLRALSPPCCVQLDASSRCSSRQAGASRQGDCAAGTLGHGAAAHLIIHHTSHLHDRGPPTTMPARAGPRFAVLGCRLQLHTRHSGGSALRCQQTRRMRPGSEQVRPCLVAPAARFLAMLAE